MTSKEIEVKLMRNNLAYFRTHLKESLRPLFFLTALSAVATFALAWTSQPYTRYTYDPVAEEHIGKAAFHSTLWLPVTVLSLCCYIATFLSFSDFKRRKSLDCYYALPVSRRALGTVHYLVGLMEILIPFCVSYLINFILLAARGAKYVNLLPMLSHFPLALLLGVIMYAVLVFAFNEANTVFDGCVFMLLFTFVGGIVVNAYAEIFDVRTLWNTAVNSFLFGMISTVTSVYQSAVEGEASVSSLLGNSYSMTWILVWVLIGVLFVFLFFYTFGKRRTEKTEEISDSFFGYRVQIPLYAVTMKLWLTDGMMGIFLFISAFVGYTLYRRGFHYKKSDLIMLGILLPLLVLL